MLAKKDVFFQLRKKLKNPPFYRGWAQSFQAFRLIFILCKLSVIGYFNIVAILSHVQLK